MVAECSAIVFIIAIFLYMMARSGRQIYVALIWPVLLVPAFHLLGIILYRLIGSYTPGGSIAFRVVVDVVGLVISALLYGILSRAIIPVAGRRIYLAVCMVFSSVLTVVLVNYLAGLAG